LSVKTRTVADAQKKTKATLLAAENWSDKLKKYEPEASAT